MRWFSSDLIKYISKDKNEPEWLMNLRMRAFDLFSKLEYPSYWPDLSKLNLEDIFFYKKLDSSTHSKSWDDVDDKIKDTFSKLWIPQAEKAFLAWVGAQYESEAVYHNLKEEWKSKGILFEDFDVAVHKYPKLLKKYLWKCVSINDHKFIALHYAVMSGGTFLYIPKWVNVTEPLQAYFRMNSENWGQFEHTIIIVEDGAYWSYIEGCSAPKFGSNALHAWCVEIFLGDWANFRYSSVENWSKDTYNLNTKRAIIWSNAHMEWVWWQMWSCVTMLYPCSVLKGNNSSSDYLWLSVAWKWQNQDTWAKIIALWKNTRAKILSKSISKDWWISTYRWFVSVAKQANNCFVTSECDSLVFDNSVASAMPFMKAENISSNILHEAKMWRISEEVIFYLESRWISQEKAKAMIVNGFFSEVTKTLPLEYAVEMNRLIEMQIEWF